MNSKLKKCSSCDVDKVIWKNYEGKKFCKLCWFKKEQINQPKQKKPLKPKSDKRAVLDQLYSVSRQQFLSRNPFCNARLDGCTTHATDVHHKAGRSKKYLDVLSWLAVCRSCHQWIELHPVEAKAAGFSISRIQDTDSD